MGKNLLIVVVALFCSVIFADSLNSAARRKNESYEQALQRFLERNANAGVPNRGGTAVNSGVLYNDLDHKRFPLVSDVHKAFAQIRDEQFLYANSKPTFIRRNSWLYPYDGCWIRATLAGNVAEKKGYVRPGKLFIFGDLTVKSKYATQGSVSWWYHVVPTVQDSSGEIYALDPAIESKGPMTVKNWILTMVPSLSKAKVAICHARTFGPSDSCDAPSATSGSDAESNIKSYLESEWSNVVDLGLDPNKVLGDQPPWL